MQPISRIYYPAIDGLRALAVISVILYHMDFDAFSGGFVGVDIFFVISGFLITRNIVDDVYAGKFSLAGFFYRRARRLFPAFFFTVFISAIFGWLLLSPAHLERFSESIQFAIISLSNFYFLREAGYFEPDSMFRPLLHFWSLAVEEQFYFVWPIILVFLLKFRKGIYVVPALLLLGTASVVVSEHYVDEIPDAVFFLMPFRLVEFAIGALCVWLSKYNLENWESELGLIVGLILIAYPVFFFSHETVFPGINSLLPCIGSALVILSAGARLSGAVLRSRIPVRIGLISYSLYLIHWPVFVFYKYWKYAPLSLSERIALIIISFILAEFMYRNIEQPYRLSHEKRIKSTPVKFLAAAAAGVAILLIPTVHAMHNDGWKWRLNDSVIFENEAAAYNCRDQQRISKTESSCTSGAERTGPADILLIGDSHAEHLVTGFDYLGKKHNLKIDVWTHYGCPPISGTFVMKKFGTQGWKEQCQEQIGKWENLINSNKYRYIILAARWMDLYESEGYGETVIRNRVLVDRENPIMDESVSRGLFSSRIRATVDEINNNGAKAIVISQIPLLTRNIQDCNRVPGYLVSNDHLQERCSDGTDYNDVIKRQLYTDKTIRLLSSENTMSVILSDYVCDPELEQCKTVMNGTLIYHDDDHVNKAGSLLVAMWLESEFLEFIK
jgi:peptidoglycan/LPS O-acetylase OafA/YrhL